MKVKLTLRRPGAPLTDIVVTADSTATVADVAHHIAATDPMRSIRIAPGETLTLSVAPPTSERLVALNPDLAIGDAPVGSGFLAEVVNLGAGRIVTGTAGARPAAHLRVLSGPAAGQEFSLPIGHFVIGREASADVHLADPLVSKRHARIAVPAAAVRPNESIATTNGTIREVVDNRIIPATETSAMTALSIAINLQFRSRLMRVPYRSSHSRRAAR